MKRVYMDRFIDSIEWVAAGFVGFVAANTSSRSCCATCSPIRFPTPTTSGACCSAFSFSGGSPSPPIAATTSPSIWCGRRVRNPRQRMIDVFATLVLLFVVTVQTYTLFDKR